MTFANLLLELLPDFRNAIFNSLILYLTIVFIWLSLFPAMALASHFLGLEPDKNKKQRTSAKDKVTIGRALAGIVGTAMGVAEEKLEEFQKSDFDSDRWEDEPEKFNPKLVDKETGQEVKLPYETVDFRGDPMTVIGFTPPHKSSSSGRIEVEGGMTEYFTGVAGLKIIGHEFDDMNESTEDDDLRDEESGKTMIQ